MKREFKGIWIPKEIWLSKDLTLQERIFLVEISSLDNSEGCFANNQYFSDFFGISKTRVSVVINSLVKKNYIASTIIYKEGSKEILKRVLNISYTPYARKVIDPMQGKFIDSNTFNNTTNNTTNKPLPVKTEKVFSEDVIYCFEQCLVFFSKKLHPENKNTWLDTIDKLNRIDGYSFSEIADLVKKIRADDFWAKNFQTINKLRNKNKDGILYHIYFTERFKYKSPANNQDQPKETASSKLDKALGLI